MESFRTVCMMSTSYIPTKTSFRLKLALIWTLQPNRIEAKPQGTSTQKSTVLRSLVESESRGSEKFSPEIASFVEDPFVESKLKPIDPGPKKPPWFEGFFMDRKVTIRYNIYNR